jgi:hypothetical protein
MNLERREKRLLEALYDPYGPGGPGDPYSFFEAKWVREEGGREYYQVTGTYHSSTGGLLDYKARHSRNSILELQECGFIVLGDTGGECVNITLTEAGMNAVDHAG